MKFIFVRHGETDWNKKGLLQGHNDTELNKTGIQQAVQLLPTLEKYHFDVIYSSSLKRAYETAKIISNHFNVPIIISDHLKEKNFGSLAGKSWQENSEATGKDLKTIDRRQQYDYSPYGGETAEEVKARVKKFIEEVKISGYKQPLVISHGGIIRVLRPYSDEVPKVMNASVHQFDL
ncbi:MAG: histidine phosphatase family protein [Patescibacteria group bacterium]|jgi:probable phosphoglycerate mutase